MDKPTELSSSQLYNFHIHLKNAAQGKPIPLALFKQKLVTTLKTPIIGDEKSLPITEVRTFITLDLKGNPISATFRLKFAQETAHEYAAKQVNGETHLIGIPQLSSAQETKAFKLLLNEIQNASPFDDIENGKNIHNAVAELAPELNLKKKK